MIEVQDYIRKLHEQTGVKLKEDDPILIELVAQQIILEEFANDLENLITKIEEKHKQTIEYINRKENSSIQNLSKTISQKLLKQRNEIKKNYQKISWKLYLLLGISLIIQCGVYIVINI